MGTPRALKPVDQIRNVQRTASRGDEIVHERVREKESCRSNEKQSGAVAFSVTEQMTFNSGDEPSFASGWEIGPAFFFEVAQQALLAQQPGLHAF